MVVEDAADGVPMVPLQVIRCGHIRHLRAGLDKKRLDSDGHFIEHERQSVARV